MMMVVVKRGTDCCSKYSSMEFGVSADGRVRAEKRLTLHRDHKINNCSKVVGSERCGYSVVGHVLPKHIK